MTYRIAKTLSERDAGYFAGLIDGEGTVTLTRKHSTQNRQLAITVSSTERPILEFLLDASGVGKITSKRTYRAHHRTSYTYAVHNRQALALLEQIQPLLRSYKAVRGRLILENYLRLTPRNGKYSAELARQRARFIEAVMSIKPDA